MTAAQRVGRAPRWLTIASRLHRIGPYECGDIARHFHSESKDTGQQTAARRTYYAYCLTDPAARPETICVCSGRNISKVGTVESAEAAITLPHSVTFSPK